MIDYKDCPNCENIGFYVVPNHHTGEPEMEQCRFCYEETDSIFNKIQTLTEALAAKSKECEELKEAVTDFVA